MDEMEQNEELVRAWIGEKKQDEYYHKMKNGGFKLSVFILPDLLFLSRKMYLEVFIKAILIDIIIMIGLVPMWVTLLDLGDIYFSNIFFSIYVIVVSFSREYNGLLKIIAFIINGIISCKYYKIYRNSILRKIRKYKRQGLTYEKQLEIARQRGGDKITLSVILMAIVVLVLYELPIVLAVYVLEYSVWRLAY